MQQIEPAVQVIGVADDPLGASSISGGVAAAHVVTDLMRSEVGDQIFDQLWGAVTAVSVISSLSSLRIGNDAG